MKSLDNMSYKHGSGYAVIDPVTIAATLFLIESLLCSGGDDRALELIAHVRAKVDESISSISKQSLYDAIGRIMLDCFGEY